MGGIIVKPRDTNLLDVLSNHDVTFYIPPYQRNYEWEKDHCEVFLNDILKTTERNLEDTYTEHFFGTIVFFENERAFAEPSVLVLIDGQQRITTAMLFLVAIRDIVEDHKTKQWIENNYLKNQNSADSNNHKIKLKQVETDWEAYLNIILKRNLSEENKQSSVYKNYTYFLNSLKEIQEEGNLDLMNLVQNGLAKFSIVTIELEPHRNKWENPQEIFESMNSLGKPLSLADLVRNYLLLGKDAQVQERLYRDYWLHIEKQLPKEVSRFIRDFMQLKAQRSYKVASESNYKELYADFKELFEGKDVELLLKDLNKFSDYYSYIVLGKESDNYKVDQELEDIRTLRITTVYSFLLGLIDKWKQEELDDSEIHKILKVLKVYFIRRRLLGLTQGENKSLPLLAQRLNEIVESSNKDEIMFETLANLEHNLRLPNDYEVSNELREMNFNNKNTKFIFSLIEEEITKFRPDKNDKTLQVEHIMPQRLNEYWISELGEDYETIHQSYLNNIGNLTLIRHNQELGNKSFQDKKKTYNNKAGLQIAKNCIIDKENWGENEIKERRDWIIKYLLQEVLKIPKHMRNRNNYVQGKRRRLSFMELQLLGEEINYISDKNIVAKVVSDNEVEFEGEIYKLSPLTREIETRKGTVNKSGSYQGAQYWEYQNIRLADIM